MVDDDSLPCVAPALCFLEIARDELSALDDMGEGNHAIERTSWCLVMFVRDQAGAVGSRPSNRRRPARQR